MRVKKLLFTVVLCCLFSVMLIGCNASNSPNNDEKNGNGSGDGEATLAKEQVLNLAISAEPPTLHPGKIGDATSNLILMQTFEGLMRLDQSGKPVEAMAESYQVSDDKLTYTFTIREDAKWSNGDPVTAHDFEYAWKWVLDPQNPDTPSADQMFVLKNASEAKSGEVSVDEVGVKALDENTLEVQLDFPSNYFLDIVANTVFYPIHSNNDQENPDWALDAGEQYVSNGPFKLESWEHKNKLVLVKNETYWDADTVILETVHLPIVTDENTEYNLFQNGEIDFAGNPTGNLPLSAIQSLKSEGTLNTNHTSGAYYYAFNIQVEPFDNVNIRKALSYAIDRQAIVDNITQSNEQPAMAYVSPTVWEQNEEGYFLDNNIEEAKELLKKGLEESGYDSVENLPEIELIYNTSEEHALIAQAIQDMWKQNLGIEITLKNEEWQVYIDNIDNKNFQLARLGYGAQVDDPFVTLNAYSSKTAGKNYMEWENDEFKDLLSKAKQETDPEKYHQLLQDAEKVMFDDAIVMPIYFNSSVNVQKDYVHDIDISNLDRLQLKWTYLTEH